MYSKRHDTLAKRLLLYKTHGTLWDYINQKVQSMSAGTRVYMTFKILGQNKRDGNIAMERIGQTNATSMVTSIMLSRPTYTRACLREHAHTHTHLIILRGVCVCVCVCV